ncbi:MAG: PspC domain-containing protein [Candidatus Hydrogenedentes bacterium]|nr:PspC domain-containing protein [Candidatus Hydrogenedentota bacterium]
MDTLALSPDRCWLGVCGGVARRFDMDTRTIRAMAVVLGLLTGPLALLAYLGLYINLYVGTEDESVPTIDRARFVRLTLGTLGGLMALYAGSSVLDALICSAYAKFAAHAPESLGSWRWLNRQGSGLFFWSLILLLPIAALAGLPLANGWERTGKKIVQAGVALYAMIICLGIASVVVGVLLQFVKDFTI